MNDEVHWTGIKVDVAVLKQQQVDFKADIQKLEGRDERNSEDLRKAEEALRGKIDKEIGKVMKVFYWFLTAGGAVIVAQIIRWVLQGGISA